MKGYKTFDELIYGRGSIRQEKPVVEEENETPKSKSENEKGN